MTKQLFCATVVAALSMSTYAMPAVAQSKPIAGGANQRSSVEGCVGQTLFDGFWRFKVTKIESSQEPGYSNIPAWAVSMELRNARSVDSTPALLGVNSPNLVLDDGTVLELSTESGIAFSQQMRYKNLPPGAPTHGTFYFRIENNTAKPAKLMLGIDAMNTVLHKSWGYPIHDPSFRVRLGCTK